MNRIKISEYLNDDITWFNQLFDENLPLILASASPRRKLLLEESGLKFKVIPSQINEEDISDTAGNTPSQKASMLALLKAEAVARHYQGVIIGADTVVALGEKIFGKPRDESEAKGMLLDLSGHIHTVITGLAFINTQNGHKILETVKTRVTFRVLSEEEIDNYIAGKEPMDKAGAYAIQGHAASFATRVEGCYTNVVGLPVLSFFKSLKLIANQYV